MSHKLSYVLAADPLVDLAIAEEMTNELEEYIVRDDVYRTLIARTPTGDRNLKMTGADLLTRLYRLQQERDQLSPAHQTKLDTVQKAADETIYSLRTRFHALLQREMQARLNGLKWFLDDCAADRQRCRVEFPFEMRNRQRIEEILKRTRDTLPDELAAQLRQVDQRIRNIAHTTEFIWDECLAPIFPKATYWYLYVLP